MPPIKKSVVKPATRRGAHSTAPALGVAATVFIVLLGLLAVLWIKPDQLPPGLIEKYWFVITVLLGFCCAVSLFAMFRSYARYKGKAFNGVVELGGPGVLMLVIVALGFALPPKFESKFDVALFLRLAGSTQDAAVQNAKVSMHLGADKRIESTDAKGVVRFIGIPAEWRGRTVAVELESPVLELLPAGAKSVKLAGEAAYLDVTWKPWRLTGLVLDKEGQPLAGSTVSLLEQQVTTDANGRFALSSTLQASTVAQELIVHHDGFRPWRNAVTPGVESIQIQLERK
jgi:hypothetical protein